MPRSAPRRRVLLSLCLLAVGTGSPADTPPRIYELGATDRAFMERQRQRIDELARFSLGRQIRSEKTNDLSVLQTLLDRRVVKPEQTLELQAMGVVMGDLLKQELGMQWVVYEDKHGRSRALQLGRTENFLFPVTMISRRAEVGAAVDIADIYKKAMSLMEPYRLPLPFR